MVKHKSGLEILAGSDQFDRPGAADGGAIEELFRLLARQYEYILVDAGSQINSCTVAALYTADTMFLVANPDVPSVRNAQRLLDRVRQLGACGERVRVLLNRAASRTRFRRSRSKARSAIRFTTRSRATTRPCRRRSTRACRSR